MNEASAPAAAQPVDEKASALQEADRLLLASERSHKVSIAGTRELKWMTVGLLALLIPLFGAPFLLVPPESTWVCYYGAIIGLVVSGWGCLRAGLTLRRSLGVHQLAAIIYLIFFILLALFYYACLSSPTLDRRWTWIWNKPPAPAAKRAPKIAPPPPVPQGPEKTPGTQE